MLKRRASKETASEMRDHSNIIRYALMASYLYVRAMEVTDDITRMAIDLIHRLDTRSEKQIHREFLADLKRVDGKMQILSRVAEAVVEQPDGMCPGGHLLTGQGGNVPRSRNRISCERIGAAAPAPDGHAAQV